VIETKDVRPGLRDGLTSTGQSSRSNLQKITVSTVHALIKAQAKKYIRNASSLGIQPVARPAALWGKVLERQPSSIAPPGQSLNQEIIAVAILSITWQSQRIQRLLVPNNRMAMTSEGTLH